MTTCPCGKVIDSGPTCKECAPAYRAGMLRSVEIAKGTRYGYNLDPDELVCQACASGVADAILKEIPK